MRAATPNSVPSSGCTCAGTGRVQGGGWVTMYKPWGGLGLREARRTHANRHLPVEPALYHRGSPTVAGEGPNVFFGSKSFLLHLQPVLVQQCYCAIVAACCYS